MSLIFSQALSLLCLLQMIFNVALWLWLEGCLARGAGPRGLMRGHSKLVLHNTHTYALCKLRGGETHMSKGMDIYD